MIDGMQYPLNYDNFDAEMVKKAVKHMNDLQTMKNFARSAGEDDLVTRYRHALYGARAAYENMGLFIRFDWPMHRNEWFACTYRDYLAMEEWLYSCLD